MGTGLLTRVRRALGRTRVRARCRPGRQDPAARCVSVPGAGWDGGLHSPLGAKTCDVQKRWDLTPESSSQRDAVPLDAVPLDAVPLDAVPLDAPPALSCAAPTGGWQVKIPFLRDPKL